MDPVTAFGLAVNIFTAVHLSQKLISKSYELYSSASGATSENADLAKITLDLEALTPRLSVPRRSIPATQDEANLRELARNCQSASNELLKLLEKLRAKKPNSKMESVRVAARNLRKKSQVESLAKKLDQYRTQIMTRVLIMTRQVPFYNLFSQSNSFKSLIPVPLEKGSCPPPRRSRMPSKTTDKAPIKP